MATTGELRAIIEQLELVDIGDAASYLGEERTMDGDVPVCEGVVVALVNESDHVLMDYSSCQG